MKKLLLSLLVVALSLPSMAQTKNASKTAKPAAKTSDSGFETGGFDTSPEPAAAPPPPTKAAPAGKGGSKGGPTASAAKGTDAKAATKADPKAPATGADAVTPPSALPPAFDPKIAVDERASDGKGKTAAAALAPGAKPLSAKALASQKTSMDQLEIGKTQLGLGKEKDAMEYFEKAVKAYPGNAEAVKLRGQVKVMRKNYPESMADLNRAAKLLPMDPEVYYWRGRAKQGQNKDKEAVADFTKAIELKPDYGDAYYCRGHSYSEMDQLKEAACPDFAKAAELGSEKGAKDLKKYCK